jgi:D-alanyl-lipoteichoic acid acyltransferase DltB (MBOAT superfamily)
MAIGGLWHGANWTFVVWGLLHGFAISAGHLWRRVGLRALPGWIAVLATFHFVLVAWVFFRAPNFTIAVNMLGAPFSSHGWDMDNFVPANAYYLVLLALFFLLHPFDSQAVVRLAVRKVKISMVTVLAAASWLIAIVVSTGNSAKFIYFDF